MNLGLYHIHNTISPAGTAVPFGAEIASMMLAPDPVMDPYVPTGMDYGQQMPTFATQQNSLLLARPVGYGVTSDTRLPDEQNYPLRNSRIPQPHTMAKNISRYGIVHCAAAIGGGLLAYGYGALGFLAIVSNDLSVAQMLQIGAPPAVVIAGYHIVRGISKNAHRMGIAVYRGMNLGEAPSFELWNEKLSSDIKLMSKGLLTIDDLEDTLKTGKNLIAEDGKSYIEKIDEKMMARLAKGIKRNASAAETLMLMHEYGNKNAGKAARNIKIKWRSVVLLDEHLGRMGGRRPTRLAMKGALLTSKGISLVQELKPSMRRRTTLVHIIRWLNMIGNDGGIRWIERIARHHKFAHEIYNEVISNRTFS